MSRHRDVRNLDYDEEYDEACDDNVYGHSVDESDYGISPGMEQYLYSRSRDNTHGFGQYFSVDADIKEEEESYDATNNDSDRSRHGSASSYERPPLSSEDEVRLASILDELRNILGDKFSEGELTQTAINHNFHLEAALNALLNKSGSGSTTAAHTPATPTSPPPSVSASSASSSKLRQGEPLPKREKKTRARDTKPPTEDMKQLSLTQGSRTHTHTPTTPAAAAAATPVIVGKGSTGTPRVVRGFDVSYAEDSQGGAREGSQLASSMEFERANKRSRSSTPVQSTNHEEDGPTAAAAAAPNATKAPAKIRDKAVDVEKAYNDLRGGDQSLLNLVVVGHVDAGKSTLMGHLLYLRGTVAQRTMHKYEQESRKMGKQSFMYAWVLDDTEEERSRGVTVDVAQRVFTTPGGRTVTLLDAPGHRDFIPNMITGAARADAAVMVVDASTGAFEAGFESGGQTREHALLVRSLGVSQLVVAVNKLDTTDWSEDRMKEIHQSLRQFLKGVGYKGGEVNYVPCSGLTGENLVKRNCPALEAWYSGPTLLEAIDALKVPERSVEKPVRMCVCDVYKGQGSNMCVSGRLDTGYLQPNDRLLLLPQGDVVTVKTIQTDTRTDDGSVAFAGDHATLTLSGVDPAALHVGDFLCDPTRPSPLTTRVQARIVVFNILVPLIKGTQLDFHYQSVTEPSVIRKLISQLHKTTGQILKARPRALTKNSAGLVELEFSRPLCLELFRDFREMGRFMLRTGGTTVAAGLVTKVLD